MKNNYEPKGVGMWFLIIMVSLLICIALLYTDRSDMTTITNDASKKTYSWGMGSTLFGGNGYSSKYFKNQKSKFNTKHKGYIEI